MALSGALLLFMGLSSAYLRRLPITTSAIYLALGLAISPVGFGLIRIDIVESKVWFEHLTEIAVIVSLFVGGLKLRLPFKDAVWQVFRYLEKIPEQETFAAGIQTTELKFFRQFAPENLPKRLNAGFHICRKIKF